MKTKDETELQLVDQNIQQQKDAIRELRIELNMRYELLETLQKKRELLEPSLTTNKINNKWKS